jgi:putative oxidoreductase
MKQIILTLHQTLEKTQKLDFLAPLLVRLYLVPVFWMAGMHKLEAFDSTVEWFGNTDWGLGLPFPFIMAVLVTAVELLGAIALLLGAGVRLISIPLMITMLVAAFTVHWENGWQAISSITSPFANERVIAASEKLAIVKNVLEEHTHYDWITSSGNVVILNNGIEFAATYFIMLLALLYLGAGRYVSVDYWVKCWLYKSKRF